MYQTLSSLYEIEKASVQELKVEKNNYKVKAFVGNRDVEINRQSIFLNGKFIPDSSLLYTKVNLNFKKYLKGGKININKVLYIIQPSHFITDCFFALIDCNNYNSRMTIMMKKILTYLEIKLHFISFL